MAAFHTRLFKYCSLALLLSTSSLACSFHLYTFFSPLLFISLAVVLSFSLSSSLILALPFPFWTTAHMSKFIGSASTQHRVRAICFVPLVFFSELLHPMLSVFFPQEEVLLAGSLSSLVHLMGPNATVILPCTAAVKKKKLVFV
jgi:hypothetical protein